MRGVEGTLIGGRYRIRRMLGRGGMGVVYEAFQEDLARAVAVKLLHPSECAGGFSPELLQRFEREARAAAALGSPHIVQVIDFQSGPEEAPFLVMELLSGQTLGDAVRAEGKLRPDRVARIGMHVLHALQAAHSVGILHRDIKPANIYLTCTATLGEVAKVLDFGIAKIASGQKLTLAGEVVGTFTYMSPEQARGEELDGRSDVFSLSLSLYSALIGRRPFSGTPEQRLLQMLSGDLRPLHELRPDLDPRLVAIVQRGLAPERDARHESAAAMSDALDSWLNGQPAPTEVAPASMSLTNTFNATLDDHPLYAAPLTGAISLPPPRAPSNDKLWLTFLAVLGAIALLGVAAVATALLFGNEIVDATLEPESGAAPVATPTPHTPSATSAPILPIPELNPSSSPLPAKPTPVRGSQPAPVSQPTACVNGKGCTVGETCIDEKCECANTYTRCKNVCVSFRNNPDNCGACGNKCPIGQYCSFGKCASCDAPGQAYCATGCTQTKVDVMNCGACGKRCNPGTLCIQGECKKP